MVRKEDLIKGFKPSLSKGYSETLSAHMGLGREGGVMVALPDFCQQVPVERLLSA